jgi:hypothetical protein
MTISGVFLFEPFWGRGSVLIEIQGLEQQEADIKIRYVTNKCFYVKIGCAIELGCVN